MLQAQSISSLYGTVFNFSAGASTRVLPVLTSPAVALTAIFCLGTVLAIYNSRQRRMQTERANNERVFENLSRHELLRETNRLSGDLKQAKSLLLVEQKKLEAKSTLLQQCEVLNLQLRNKIGQLEKSLLSLQRNKT